MKVNVLGAFVVLSIVIAHVETREIRHKKRLQDFPDYEASGDYFEMTVMQSEVTARSTQVENFEGSTTTLKASSNEDSSSYSTDDGVTCSASNFTDIYAGYELENHVLVIFRVNVSANERELVLFLNLAKRFDAASSIFPDCKFIVITTDRSSDIVMDFIDKEEFPADIVVIDDEDDDGDFGFVIDLDELNVFVADQCGMLTFIIVPPWSSAQHPYVKAAIISTIIDQPCGCPSDTMSAFMKDFTLENATEHNHTEENRLEDYDGTQDSSATSTTDDLTTLETTSFTSFPVIDIETDEIENIEDLLDNSNDLSPSMDGSKEIDLPIRIIIPSVHIHFDEKNQNYWKYEQFVLKTGNQSFHDHLQHGEKLLEIHEDVASLKNLTSFESKIFVGNRSLKDIQKIAKSDKIFVDRSGKSYKFGKALVTIDNVFEIIPIEFDIVKDSPTHQIYGVKHHYEKLNRWLLFQI